MSMGICNQVNMNKIDIVSLDNRKETKSILYKSDDIVECDVMDFDAKDAIMSLGDIRFKQDRDSLNNKLGKNVSKGDRVLYKVDEVKDGKIKLSLLDNVKSQSDLNINGKEAYELVMKKQIASDSNNVNGDNDENNSDVEESKENKGLEESNKNALNRLNNNAFEEKIKEILNYDNIDIKDLTVEKFLDLVKEAMAGEENFVSESMTENDKYVSDMHAKYKDIKNVNENVLARIIKEDKAFTLNNLYIAKFKVSNQMSGIQNNILVNSSDLYDSQLDQVLKYNDCDVNEENRYVARVLIDNDVDVTYENIQKLKDMKKALLELSDSKTNEMLSYNVLNGDIIDLFLGSEKMILVETEKSRDILNAISNDDELLSRINASDMSMSLSDIENMLKDNLKSRDKVNGQVNVITLNNDDMMNDSISDVLLNLKENIASAALELTMKSVVRMYNMGIDVKYDMLKDVLNKIDQIKLSDKSVAEVKDFINCVGNLDNLEKRDYAIYTKYIRNTDTKSTNTDANSANTNDNNIDNNNLCLENLSKDNLRYLSAYSEVESGVRYTFDTEVNIAYRNIDEILKMNDIEINDINRKCGIALSLNNIDINMKNIELISELEQKTDYVVSNLKTKDILSLIDDGIDPSKISMDELIEYISQDQVSNNSKDSNDVDMRYSELAKMISNNMLSDEEKNVILGVYKMINKISKSHNAGVGVFLEGQDVSISDIFNATKYIQRKKESDGFNVKIDEKFGELSNIMMSDKNASEMIRRAMEKITSQENKNKRFETKQKQISDMIKFANENKDIINELEIDLLDATLDDLGMITAFENNKKIFNVNNQKYISSELNDEINKMNKKIDSNEVEVSDNIEYEGIIKDTVERLIEDEIDNIGEASSISELAEGVDNDRVRLISSLSNEVYVTDKYDGVYKLPYKVDDSISNVNVYFDSYDESVDTSNIIITANFENIGEVKCNLSIEKRFVNVDLKVNDEAKVEGVINNLDLISDVFSKYDLEILDMKVNQKYVKSNSRNAMYDAKLDNAFKVSKGKMMNNYSNSNFEESV